MKISVKYAVTGALSGAANGFFGAGGGLFLVPLLISWCGMEQKRAFATSVAVIFPLCAVSAVIYRLKGGLPIAQAVPYLLGRRRAGRKVIRQGKGRLAAPCIRRADSLRRRPCRPAAVSAVLAVAIGLLTGILSGFGIGGGSLLLLYLTLFEGAGQYQAGGINLLYFLSCAPAALISHRKNGLIEREAVKCCVPAGVVTSVLSALLAARVDTDLLRRAFGVVLLYIGVKETFLHKK